MSNVKVRNLYNLILQRDPENSYPKEYDNYDQETIVSILKNSQECQQLYRNKCKKFSKETKVFDYAIIHINDRAKEYMDEVKNTLVGYRYHDIQYFNSKESTIEAFFSPRNIKLNWDPSHSVGRLEPLMGEYGIYASTILCLEYMVEKQIPHMIVFEDDVKLQEQFLRYFYSCFFELPNDYDFLADNTYFPNERIVTSVNKTFLYKTFICKAHLQNAHLGFMLYSLQGAKKILDFIKRDGFFAPIDTTLFYYSRNEQLNGFTTYPFNKLIEDKDFLNSMIDDHNIRL